MSSSFLSFLGFVFASLQLLFLLLVFFQYTNGFVTTNEQILNSLSRSTKIIPYSKTNFNRGDDIDDDDLLMNDEELIRLIRGPLGASRPRARPKAMLVLSDGTGVTAKAAIEKALAQFNGCGDERFLTLRPVYRQFYNDDDLLMNNNNDENDEEEGEEILFDNNTDNNDEPCELVSTKLYPFIGNQDDVAQIIKQQSLVIIPLVVFTFGDPELRYQTAKMCELSNIPYIDLFGPMFDTMSKFLNRKPMGTFDVEKQQQPVSDNNDSDSNQQQQQPRRLLSDNYFRRIEAVEFTLKCDDGMSPNLLPQADVVLLGVSRTGKTPLSVVLAQTMGLKVANIPLVVDLPPPKQLFQVDPKRVFCLVLNIQDLMRIRKNRLRKELAQATGSSTTVRNTYADVSYLERDLANAKKLTKEHNFTLIDVSGRAVEESASLISSYLNERFPMVDQDSR